MKHKKLNMLIIVLITIFVLWYLLKDNYKEIIGVLANANYFWIFVAVIMYFVYLFFDVLAFSSLTKMYTNRIKLKTQIYIGIINKFFAGITPLATGGQPMQVYELHKNGVSYSNGTNIAVQAYMIFQVALMIMATLAIILNKVLHLFAKVPVLSHFTLIGFIINFGILIILLCVSFSKNFNKVVVNFIIKLLTKLHIVKNKEKQIDKWNKRCNEYYENAQILLKNKSTFIKGVLFELISLTVYYLIPCILAYALGFGSSVVWYASLSASAYVFIMGCYVPIPGATGGMEYAFTGFFGNFIQGFSLNAFVVMWRFITYYMPVIFGSIIFNIHQSNHKNKSI